MTHFSGADENSPVAQEPVFGSWRGIIVFCLLAYGLSWIVVLPLWLEYDFFFGPDSPAGQLMSTGSERPSSGEALVASLVPLALMSLMMFTPAVSALFVMRVVEKVPFKQAFAALGAGSRRNPDGSPHTSQSHFDSNRSPAVRIILFCLLAVGLAFVLSAASGLAALMLGGFEPDWQMTAVREHMAEAGLPLPLGFFLLLQIVQVVIAAFFPNGVFALGEELGWRGYLTAAFRRRGVGTVPMIIVSGAIWGAWHAPVLLLGHNFDTRSPVSIPIMMVGCIFLGAVLVWLREVSGSIWPAAIGHGAFNAAAGISIMFAVDAAWTHPIIANPLGVSGWLVIGPVAVILFLVTGRARSLRSDGGHQHQQSSQLRGGAA